MNGVEASHAREQQLRSELRELAQTLPGLLSEEGGLEWRAEARLIESPTPCLFLRRDDGMGLNLHAARLAPSRFEIVGLQPESGPYWHRYDIDSGKITVTRAKTAGQVAAEIRRRLVPWMDATVAVITARQLAHAASVGRVDDAARLLETVPSVTSAELTERDRRDGYDRHRTLGWLPYSRRYNAPHARMWVRHDSDRGVVIELEGKDLTPALVHAALTAMHNALVAEAHDTPADETAA